MKKAIIGTLAGFVLLAGVAVSAADLTNKIIGKKVAGVMTVSVDGKALGKEAVVIDGVSYLPVRDATAALGSEVIGVKNRHITIASKGSADVSEDVAAVRARLEQEIVAQEMEVTKAKEMIVSSIHGAIEANQKIINTITDRMSNRELLLEEYAGPPNSGDEEVAFKDSIYYSSLMTSIAADKAEIARFNAEIEKLKLYLAELAVQ